MSRTGPARINLTLPKRIRKPLRYRIVQPYVPSVSTSCEGLHVAPQVCYAFWPPRFVEPYSEREAASVMQALCQRWLDCRRWPPAYLEPWADYLPSRAKPNDISPKIRSEVAFTLRDYTTQAVQKLAARRGYLLKDFLLASWRRYADDSSCLDEDTLWLCQILWSVDAHAAPESVGRVLDEQESVLISATLDNNEDEEDEDF